MAVLLLTASAATLPQHPFALNTIATAFLVGTSGIHCYLPGSSAPHRGVDPRNCRPTLTCMLEALDAYHPQRYRAPTAELATLSTRPCAISMDLPSLHGDIYC